MPERPQRQVRAVDVVLVPLRATARGPVAVVERHLADVLGHGHGQLAARARRPRTGRPRWPAGRPRRAPTRAGPRTPARASRGMATGRPEMSTMTTGVPVAATAATSSPWRPRKPSSIRSRVSPQVDAAVRPERSPSTRMAASAPRAASTAAARSASSPSRMPQPARVADLACLPRRVHGCRRARSATPPARRRAGGPAGRSSRRRPRARGSRAASRCGRCGRSRRRARGRCRHWGR